MARPPKAGLDYFPLDCDIDQDDKIYFLESKYGLLAFAVVIRLLMLIYKEGYYRQYSEDKDVFILAKRFSVDADVIKNVVNDCINEGFFNSKLFKKYGILTSRGIQKRYLKACERRKEVKINPLYLLVDPESYENLVIENTNEVNADINPVNDDKSTQSKEEYIDSRVKEIYTHWNSKTIIQHRSMTQAIKSAIKARIESNYPPESIVAAITNYAEVLNSEKYYWTHKWTLKDFLNPNNLDRFLTESEPFKNFLKGKADKKEGGAVDDDIKELEARIRR